MIPVAIVSPAAIAPQSAAPQGAAPGGVFAALFAALAQRPAVESADPAASPKGDAGANVIAVLQDEIAGMARPAKPGGDQEAVVQHESDSADGATPLPAMAMLAPPLTVAPGTPSKLEPAPESTAALLAPATAPPATAHEGAPASPQDTPTKPLAEGGGTPPPASREPVFIPASLVVSAPARTAEPVAVVMPPAVAIPSEAPVQAALPAQPALQGAPKASGATIPETIGATTPMQDDQASDTEPPPLQPAAQAKKPAPATGDTKPATSDAKPAAFQTAAAGGNSSSFFVASTTPDAFMPLPATDAAGQVKTVPLSNLANLPNGAAVTAIGAVIAGEAASGTNRFLIRLDPPELGRIDVRLRFGRDGEVHARLIADRPETVSLLMRDAATLERALNASGMRTADGIDVMLRDSSGGFAHNDGGLGGDAPAEPSYRAPAITADSESDPPPAWTRPELSGRLDLTV